MHILVIPSWYPSNHKDINGSFFREQALAAKDAGIRVGVISPQMSQLRYLTNNPLKYGYKYENDNGIPTLRYFGLLWLPRIPFGNSLLWVNVGIRLFKKYIKTYGKPDLIHAHSVLYAGVLAERLNREFSVPYVITEHSSIYSRGIVKDWELRIGRLALCRSQCNIAVSTRLACILKEYYKIRKEWVVLPNMLSDIYLKEPTFKKNDIFTLLHISSLDKNKNVKLIIQAFSILNRKSQSIRLVIGGNNNEVEKLKKFSDKYGVSQYITFVGKIPREKTIEYYSQADLFILSSNFETFGVVLIEALSQGLPIVSTACGGPEDIVNVDNGLLVRSEKNAMAEAIDYIRSNYQMYEKIKIRNDSISKYGKNNVICNLIDIYKSVLY